MDIDKYKIKEKTTRMKQKSLQNIFVVNKTQSPAVLKKRDES